jgi:hypothetical protein
MRKYFVLFILLLVSCGGGEPVIDPPGQDVDPTGHWIIAGSDVTFDVIETNLGYDVDYSTSGMPVFKMTVSDNNFTITGAEDDLSGRWHTDFTITGTIAGDTMTANEHAVTTDTWTQEQTTEDSQYTATRT